MEKTIKGAQLAAINLIAIRGCFANYHFGRSGGSASVCFSQSPRGFMGLRPRRAKGIRGLCFILRKMGKDAAAADRYSGCKPADPVPVWIAHKSRGEFARQGSVFGT